MPEKFLRWPQWLKDYYREKRGNIFEVQSIIKEKKLHTVCQEAHCPNIKECFGSGKATFLIMGNICTRNCRFCNIKSGNPLPLDYSEIDHIIESINTLNLNYVVITSVTRDDLIDGGASFYKILIEKIRNVFPEIGIEILIPDFKGDEKALTILKGVPFDVLNHNIETVPELYKNIRPQANFNRSLKVLEYYKKAGYLTKSGIMVGLGETMDQIERSLKKLREVNVDIVTIGQYLQPSLSHYPVQKYYTFGEFDALKKIAEDMGFKEIFAGPFVRSSYRANETRLVKRRV